MSHRIIVFISALFCITALAYASIQPGSGRDWENPAVFTRGQEEAHTPLAPFNSVEQALGYDKFNSPWLHSLNGEWKFSWFSSPVQAPADFYQPNYNVNTWPTIQVPGNWQMQGFGHPLFRNIQQPFISRPPFVPDDYNPVGLYRRTFTIPASWNGRQVFLHFEGVHSASQVWVNGVEAGYNQGGMEPAEYNITPLLQAGNNTLAVRVYRYSDGAYLEDQDMWRLSGIYRHVYLYATPAVHLRDFFIWPDLDKNYQNGLLKIMAQVKNFAS
ncbi:MAG TPA: hypothetical protein PLP19_20770 [bacterium]|nr:hypothetical protein [bacterium]HPN45929.1 hypothetical protein [bacterium]